MSPSTELFVANPTQNIILLHLCIDFNNNSGCWNQVKRQLVKSFLKNVQSQWCSTQDAGMLYYPPQPHIPFFSVVLLVLVGITYFPDSLMSLQRTLLHEIISYFWGGTGSTGSFHFCHTWLVNDITNTPMFSHPSSSVGHLWSFPLNIILTAAGTWLISCRLISSVWPSG